MGVPGINSHYIVKMVYHYTTITGINKPWSKVPADPKTNKGTNWTISLKWFAACPKNYQVQRYIARVPCCTPQSVEFAAHPIADTVAWLGSTTKGSCPEYGCKLYRHRHGSSRRPRSRRRKNKADFSHVLPHVLSLRSDP